MFIDMRVLVTEYVVVKTSRELLFAHNMFDFLV